ncbi:MAG: OmpA family protein [Deltaproteobacteria bacterium]|nr:OmpA family protein [Deltaproteobacteria bacterium]
MLVATICAPLAASAQDRPIDVQLWTPPASRGATLLHERGGVLSHLTLSAGVLASYALEPFVRDDDGEDVAVVSELVSGEAAIALGLFELFEVAVSWPVVFGRVADDVFADQLERSARFATGDVRLSLKWRFLRWGESDGLAAQMVVSLPVGGDFAGARSWTFAPALIASRRVGRLTLAGTLGFRLRQRATLGAFEQDDELFVGGGGAFEITRALDVTLDLHTRIGVGGRSLNVEQVPAEADVGVRFRASDAVTLEAGAGTGLSPGYGTPALRAMVGIRFTTERRACPHGPEDDDGFEDADFCADPDNDRDGILDAVDQCPNDAEDIDEFEDSDGCPDPDDDADGFLDPRDTCPSQPEDRDGHQDDDGCPEVDNDGDGVPDLHEECDMEPEDRDGFEDDDGCPEPGPNVATVTVVDMRILVSERIYFDYDSDSIRGVSLPLLDQVAEVIQTLPATHRVRIEGYTDGSGDAEYNLDLSFRRSRSVLEYLVSRGIQRARLEHVGYGETRPVTDDSTPEGQALNRRVEFTILEPDRPEPEAQQPPSGAPQDDRAERRRRRRERQRERERAP